MQTSQSNEESPTDSEGEGQQEQHQNHRHRRWFTVLQSLSLVAVLLLAVYNHALIDAAPEETLATPWLVESEPFEPLAPCNEGGSRLHTGFDVNGNGMLDLGERMDTVVLCHGMRGLSGPQGQPGTGGLDAVPQRLETTTIPVGNSTCPEGGVMILSGLDVNFNEQLEHEETATQNVLCNGRIGDNGLNGSDGTDGTTGATALVNKVAAPSYVCADGFVIQFGVDDGAGSGQAHNGMLEKDEVRETLNFCFEPLRSERVSDVFVGAGNSMTTGCDEAVWSSAFSGFFFAANDGVNGCELHVHRPETNTTTMVADLHPNGDALPGRDLGLTVLGAGERVLFDATDGASPRQLWVTDGTANGTEALGAVEAWSPLPWGEGMLFRSTSNQLVWTNGSDLQNDVILPSWSTEVALAVQANLSALSQMGQAWIHTDGQALWFSAADENGDVEPYRLSVDGALTTWTINDFGSAQLSNLLTVGNDVLAVGVRGGVKQILQLYDNGTHAWLTSIAPASGDTHLGEGMGLHLIGDNLVYDAITSANEARLWTTNLANGITLQLSTDVQAPGAQVGVANTGTRLLFDCLTPSRGMEVCITDGTPHGSRVLHDLTPGLMSSDIRGLAPVGEDWVVIASGSVNGTAQGMALWAVEGTAMRLAYDPWPGLGNSSQALNYGALVLSPTQAWFIAHDGAHGHEWHRWSHGELSDDWIVIHR
ncbi:MAG: hypothetical protein DWC03_07630 [Candidatus Poseidoniales archaeon]|nr:MAG: hypothetical protein DWC03_07630 [Candidatus Poseidoniales archaeon]